MLVNTHFQNYHSIATNISQVYFNCISKILLFLCTSFFITFPLIQQENTIFKTPKIAALVPAFCIKGRQVWLMYPFRSFTFHIPFLHLGLLSQTTNHPKSCLLQELKLIAIQQKIFLAWMNYKTTVLMPRISKN